ncbi:MAG: radical SAM protein [Desulfotomaculales bacterium]
MKVASVEITTACNLTCAYCEQARTGTHMPEEIFRRVLEECRRWGAAAVALGGGEPLLHPEVGRFLHLARKRGFVTALTTNATVTPGPAVLEHLDHLGVSAGKGRWAELPAAVRGRGPTLTANILLLRGGLTKARDLAAAAVGAGFRRLLFLSYKGRNPTFRPNTKELVALFTFGAFLRWHGLIVGADAYTYRRLGLRNGCGQNFRRWDVRGIPQHCCFPVCEFFPHHRA